MILDAQGQFSNNQALTATALSTNVIDFSQNRIIGTGEEMAVVINVEASADTSSNNETYQFDVEAASDAGITNSRKLLGRRIFQAGTVTPPNQNANLLVTGFTFTIPIPKSKLSESDRFLGVRYTLGGTTPSISVSAHLVPMKFVQMDEYFPANYQIS